MNAKRATASGPFIVRLAGLAVVLLLVIAAIVSATTGAAATAGRAYDGGALNARAHPIARGLYSIFVRGEQGEDARTLPHTLFSTGLRLAAEDADIVTQLHHSDPLFMGGEAKQPLTELSQAEHQALHGDMNDFLRNETDDFGNHMRPQRGNSGPDIRANFTRDQRLDALARFYSGPGSQYEQAAADFFAQHPELAP